MQGDAGNAVNKFASKLKTTYVKSVSFSCSKVILLNDTPPGFNNTFKFHFLSENCSLSTI